MRTVKVGISDRYSLMELLIPMRGSFTEMITCKAMLKEVEITEQEMIRAGLVTSEKGITWVNELEKEIEFSSQRLEVVKKAIIQFAEFGGLSGIIGNDLVFSLKFTPEEKQKLLRLVDDLDKEGKIDNSTLQACINVKGLR